MTDVNTSELSMKYFRLILSGRIESVASSLKPQIGTGSKRRLPNFLGPMNQMKMRNLDSSY